MFVKLYLFVICAVLLNFGECNKCEDVYKCVSNWIGAALSQSTNFTVDTIEDVSEIPKTSESDDNLLTDLTRFLVNKFSDLFKQGRLLEVVGNKTKIYVQTFKINDSFFETDPEINVSAVESNVTDKNYNNVNHYNPSNSTKLQHLNHEEIASMKEKKTTTSIYWVSEDFLGIENKYSASSGSESVIETTTDKHDMVEKDNILNTYNETYAIETQYSTDATVNIINEKTTTSVYLNTENSPEIKNKYNEMLQNATIIEITTVTSKVIETNYTDIHKQAINIEIENVTHGVNEIPKTMTLAYLDSNNNTPTTPKVNINDNALAGNKDTQRNEIADNFFHGDNNEIDISELIPDNLTDYLDIDYVDIYKDTTNEYVEYTPVIYTHTTTEPVKLLVDEKPEDGIDSVYPWIAALFVMNSDNKQFEYICDGILVSERIVLTAARCVIKSNATVEPINILVILGKRSLQTTGPNEIVLRVKSIKLHENFISTEGKVDNDLAVIVLDEGVSFNVDVQPAPLGVKDTSEPLVKATTGWHVTGPLLPLYLEIPTTNKCMSETDSKNIFCSTLGDNETTCPSYGGILVDRQDDHRWRVKGIATGNPMNKGVCFNKDLAFTTIGNYLEWIMKGVKEVSK